MVKHYKIFIPIILLLMVVLPELSFAQANPYQDTEISVACPANGQLFARIIGCFEDKFYKGTEYFVSELYPKYVGTVQVLMSVAVVILGMMLATGGVQSTPKDTMTLLLKMVAVIFFMENVMFVYSEFTMILSSMVNELASAGSDTFGGTLRCPAKNLSASTGGVGIITTPVWERVDCIIDGLIGISADVVAGGTTSGTGSEKPDMSRGMMAFFYNNLKSGSLGLLIGLAGLYIAFNLMLSLFKAAYSYLVAIAIISLMFVIGIIMIPGIFFTGTYGYFEKWYRVILGMLIQPIILFTYLNVMMIAFDMMLFSGENSIQQLVCQSGSSGGGSGGSPTSINQCAEDRELYIDKSIAFAKEFDPTNIPTELSANDLGTLGNIQVIDEDVDFTKKTSVPIDIHRTVVDYKKIDPAELAAATLLAGLCSYILLMFMNQIPAMATELAGGIRSNPSIIAGSGSDVSIPFDQQLNSLAAGKPIGDATKGIANSVGSLIGGR